MDELLEKNAEEIMLKTTTLLADCVEKLSKEINPAQSPIPRLRLQPVWKF